MLGKHVKPSDLDPEGRLRAALINIIINGALIVQVHKAKRP